MVTRQSRGGRGNGRARSRRTSSRRRVPLLRRLSFRRRGGGRDRRRVPKPAVPKGDVASRGRVLRRRWIAVLSVVTVVGLAYVLLFTSLLGVRSVEVAGARDVPEEQILDRAQVPDLRPMLRLDTGAIAERVAEIPGIATVDVSRSLPSTVEIAVTERTPAGVYDTGSQLYLVDVGGVVYKEISEPPQGLPEFSLSEVAPNNPETRAVIQVREALPEDLAARVTEWRAETPGSVEFTLRSGKTVRWGNADDSERKAQVLGALMTRDGKTYDVSSPELPTVS
ncbi:cell division protein FtsQ [Saccharomonospora sp. CUA-673]|uniref:cell division protein FtsQ/DivIB n=1 Tax=Saccharomonospora sp. CUA-673 TaxID=1904969 RepID=UPI000964F75D|nr:FtsQ-type POTRA domain-containing protein [Saccharomonospora sp. CUA-673]OLT48571.1 cell division protein FtsQ [Saccharomonospora sp. CUA-673]